MSATATDKGLRRITEEMLNGFSGCDGYPCRRMGVNLTDGAFFLDQNGAGWLIDAILIVNRLKPLAQKTAGFQHWTLKKNKTGSGAVLTCDDGGYEGGKPKVVYRQKIEYTDFPLPEVKLYLTDGVLLLPGEY